MNQEILYPVFSLFIFTHIVMLIMLYLRVSGVKKGVIDPKHFKTYDLGVLPRKTLQASRHFSNLFEIPILFYIGCLIIFIKGNSSQIHIILAWSFVAFRLIHGFIHMTSNKIIPRLGVFTVSVVMNILLWIAAIFN